jgi:hypothetical protein
MAQMRRSDVRDLRLVRLASTFDFDERHPIHAAVRTLLSIAGDVLRLLSTAVRSHVHLSAENLFLRKQLAL